MNEINSIDIRYASENKFLSDSMDGVCHVKALPWLSVVQAKSGSYDIKLGAQPTLHTGEGGFFIAASGVQQTITHHHNPLTNQMECRWVFLDVVINHAYRFDHCYLLPTVLTKEDAKELNATFDTLFAEVDPYVKYACYYQILHILHTLSTPKYVDTADSLLTIPAYIEEHYASPLHIAELAKLTHMSESNFYASFRKQYGTSPIAYLNCYRMSIASELLKNTEMSIADIADSVGVHDPVYFNKLFRKTYQLSPRNYRKIHQKT